MISSSSFNTVKPIISDNDSKNSKTNQPADGFAQLLSQFSNQQLSSPNGTQQGLASKEDVDSFEMKEEQEDDQEKDQQTRDDLNPILFPLHTNEMEIKTSVSNQETKDLDLIDRTKPNLREKEMTELQPNKLTIHRSEGETIKIDPNVQQNGTNLDKFTKQFPETNVLPKLQPQHLQNEDTKSTAVTLPLTKKETDFKMERPIDGKEVIFQSLPLSGNISTTVKHDQTQNPKGSVEKFSSEIIELVRNQASLKKTSDVIEAKFSLTPEKLGDIDVKLAIHKGQVTAHFSAETLMGKEQLESQISLLRSSLQQQGFQVEKIEISLSGQGLAHSFTQQEGRSRQDQSQQQFSKKKIHLDEVYQSHASLDEYKPNSNENRINILA